jgi:metal-sulfur cluster biosynthetic enzyme
MPVDKAQQIKEKLKEVIDPETGINVVEMDMIEKISVDGNSARIAFRPTIPECPLVAYLSQQIKGAAETVVKKAEVQVLRD